MLRHVRGYASERKHRLFAVACCRAFADRFPTPAYHDLLELVTVFADGTIARVEMMKGYRAPGSNSQLAMAVAGTTDPNAGYAAQKTLLRTLEWHDWVPATSPQDLLRDIFGNPFRPVAFDPAWRTEAVVGLARGAYEDRAFDRLPALADALEDAGCADADILSHCRSAGSHVRGCWVVDLLLGKT